MRFKRPKNTLFVHRGTTVTRLPSGKIDVRDDWGIPDDLPNRPEMMACDCCLTMADRHWYWSHRGFSIRTSDGSSFSFDAGEWAVCVYCRPLFERAQLEALVARVVTLNPVISAANLRQLYGVLFEALQHSGPSYWEAPQPYGDYPTYSDEEMAAILLRS